MSNYTQWQAIGHTTCGRPAGLPEPGQALKDCCEKSLEVYTNDGFKIYNRRYAFPAESDDRDKHPKCRRDVFIHHFMLEDFQSNHSTRVEEYWTIEHQIRTVIEAEVMKANVHTVGEDKRVEEGVQVDNCSLHFDLDTGELKNVINGNGEDITDQLPIEYWIAFVEFLG